MKILNETPNILKISYRQEKGDENYGSCLWATFLFDLNDYTLHIESDCGNYAYGWCVTPSESFIHLMCRIDGSYLLNKISYRTEFKLEKSIANTCDNIKCYRDDNEEYSELIEEIKEIEDNYGEESFYRECDNIMGRYDFSDTFEIIECVKEYPTQAVRIIEIFRDYIQPYIRKLGDIKCSNP